MPGEEKEDIIEDIENEELSTFSHFVESLKRARALIHLQQGIDLLFDSEGDIFNYLINKSPETPFTDLTKRIMDIGKNSVQNGFISHENELKEIAEKINPKDIEDALKPLIHVFEAIGLIHENPLYHEAVVSSVTSFETYLKDTIISLIAHNKEIENRFYPELKEGISYDKIKEYDYDYHDLFGCIVNEKVKFYKLDNVEKIFKRALDKTDGFSLFKDTSEKDKLQQFFELRHIIVHNGGYVDHKFKKTTKCPQDVNEYYEIDKDNVEAMMDIMMDVVNKIKNELEDTSYILECKSEEEFII